MPLLRLKSFLSILLIVCPALVLATELPETETIQPHTVSDPGLETSVQTPSVSAQDSDLWNRIRQGYGIPDLDNTLVQNQLNWYGSRTDYLLRSTGRASRYLYHVVEELEKRGMPTELALLPFIESAFNPQAVSSAKASGMWQFIPSTGKDFKLKQNMFKDERRGVLDSTDAALTYLQKLYDMFGDWQLALAAYNWGEGSVQRAIKKQQAAGLPIDFNSMSYLMPKETQNYVPKLQAVKNIISHPEQFNLALPKLDNQPYFASVDKNRDIDVRVAAQLAELSLAEFRELNPQFNRPVITGAADTKILLPAENVEIYRTNLSKWEGPLCTWTAYMVGKDERIESIAHRLGTTAPVLQEVNQIPGNMLVRAGSTLLIPRTVHTVDNDIPEQLADSASLTMTRDEIRRVSVSVGRRDTLASIAKRYRVSSMQLKDWNNLKSETLQRGQKLQVEVAVAPARPALASRLASALPRKKLIARIKDTKKITVAQAKTARKPG